MRKIVRWMIILGVAAAIGLMAVKGFPLIRGQAAGPAVDIPVFTVKPANFEVRLSALGAMQAASSRQVVAPFSGKILRIVDEGIYVNEGDPLVWMETTDFEDQLENDEVELELAKNDLEQQMENHRLLLEKHKLSERSYDEKVKFQQQKLADSEKQYENTRVLVANQLAPMTEEESRNIDRMQSRLSLEDAKIELQKFDKGRAAEVQISLSDIEKKKAMVDKYQRSVDDTKQDIDQAVIRAPGPGYVAFMVFRMGGSYSKISEGTQVYQRTPLLEIPDSTKMLAKVPINETDITQVSEEQRAEIHVLAFPDKVFSGKVVKKGVVPVTDTSFRRMMQQESSVKEFEVTIELAGEDKELRPGMTASVDIIVQEPRECLAIPQEAVYTREEGTVVFRKLDGGYESVPVELGDANLNSVEVKKGLQEGDSIYLRDPEERLQRISGNESFG